MHFLNLIIWKSNEQVIISIYNFHCLVNVNKNTEFYIVKLLTRQTIGKYSRLFKVQKLSQIHNLLQRWATPTPKLELTPEFTLFYSELELILLIRDVVGVELP